MPTSGETMLLGIAVELDASGVVRGVSLAERSLDQLDKRADDTVRRANERNRGVQQGMQMAAGAATALGASTLAIGEIARRGLLTPMIQESEEFEVELSQLRFASTATAEELAVLEQRAIDVGLSTQFSPTQSVAALRMLRQAGLDSQQAFEALGPTLDIATAAAGKMDLPTAAAAVAASMNKMNVNGETSRQMMDSFARATQRTNLQMENLPVIINAMGGLSRRFRMPSSEVFAFAGILRSTGQLSAQASQSLRIFADNLLRNHNMIKRHEERGGRFTAKMEEMRWAMERLNVQLYDSQGGLRPMVDVFADITEQMETVTTDSERLRLEQALLGPQAGAVLSALAGYRDQVTGLTGGRGFRALINETRNATGASRDAAKAFEETAKGLRIFIVGTIQTMMVLLGKQLAPILHYVMIGIRNVLGSFVSALRASPLLAKAVSGLIISLIGLTFVIGPLLLGFGALLFIASALVPIVTATAATLSGVGMALGGVAIAIATVFGVIVSAFGGIIASGTALYMSYKKNLGGLKDFIDDWIKDIGLIWKGLVDFFKSDDGSISAAIIKQLEDRNLLGTVLTILSFTRRIEEVWAGMKDVVVPAIGVIVSVFGWMLETVIWVIDGIEEALASLGFKFDVNMDYWRTFGQIIGIIITVAGFLSGTVLTGLAVILGIIAVKMLIATLPFLLFVGLVVATIWAVVKIVQFFKLLGQVIVIWSKNAIATVKTTAQTLFEPFIKAFNVLSLIWERLSAADAPWRRWAVPWFFKWVQVPIINPIKERFAEMANFLSTVWTGIVTSANIVWIALKLIVNSAIANIVALFGVLGTALSPVINVFAIAGSAIGGFLFKIWDGVTNLFADLIAKAAEWGSQFIETILGGVKKSWTGFIEFFSVKFAEVRDLLPSSDAKTGPFSDLTASGSSLITTFMSGAEKVVPELPQMLSAVFDTSINYLQESPLGTIGESLGLPSIGNREEERSFGQPDREPIRMEIPLAGGTDATGLSSGQRTNNITFGNITINVQQATPEEAERLSEIILEKIKSSLENDMEATFA